MDSAYFRRCAAVEVTLQDVRHLNIALRKFSLIEIIITIIEHCLKQNILLVQANAAEQMVDPPPLSYKKWEYEECRVSDCDSIGLETPTPFDHMLTASIMGGQSAKCSKSPITSSIFVACGERPYAAFMYGQEGQSEPLISEFAFAVASRLKNSFFNMAG